MAERTLHHFHPADRWTPALRALTTALGGRLVLGTEHEPAAVDLRLDPAHADDPAVGRVLGAALPRRPNTWVERPDGHVLWLGPDQWLVTDDRRRPEAWEAELRAVVGPLAGAATDVSAQRTGLRVRGPLARTLLASCCSLDLHPDAFPTGACARTLVGRADVVLVGLHAGDDFRLLVRPSFAGHLVDLLVDAGQELRAETAPPTAPLRRPP